MTIISFLSENKSVFHKQKKERMLFTKCTNSIFGILCQIDFITAGFVVISKYSFGVARINENEI
jgi:hypothetical protein